MAGTPAQPTGGQPQGSDPVLAALERLTQSVDQLPDKIAAVLSSFGGSGGSGGGSSGQSRVPAGPANDRRQRDAEMLRGIEEASSALSGLHPVLGVPAAGLKLGRQLDEAFAKIFGRQDQQTRAQASAPPTPNVVTQPGGSPAIPPTPAAGQPASTPSPQPGQPAAPRPVTPAAAPTPGAQPGQTTGGNQAADFLKALAEVEKKIEDRRLKLVEAQKFLAETEATLAGSPMSKTGKARIIRERKQRVRFAEAELRGAEAEQRRLNVKQQTESPSARPGAQPAGPPAQPGQPRDDSWFLRLARQAGELLGVVLGQRPARQGRDEPPPNVPAAAAKAPGEQAPPAGSGTKDQPQPAAQPPEQQARASRLSAAPDRGLEPPAGTPQAVPQQPQAAREESVRVRETVLKENAARMNVPFDARTADWDADKWRKLAMFAPQMLPPGEGEREARRSKLADGPGQGMREATPEPRAGRGDGSQELVTTMKELQATVGKLADALAAQGTEPGGGPPSTSEVDLRKSDGPGSGRDIFTAGAESPEPWPEHAKPPQGPFRPPRHVEA